MKRHRLLAAAALAAAFSTAAQADQEASNVAHVATDEYGRCLAHSIPDALYEPGGVTRIYAAGKELTLLHSYDWFAQTLYVACAVSNGAGIIAEAVVQFGPWPRGNRPNDETLAVAFHYNGEEVARFSTLDIAGRDPRNASSSVSHYTVIERVIGFSADRRQFSLETVDGRTLTFDVLTGEMTQAGAAPPQTPFGACYRGAE